MSKAAIARLTVAVLGTVITGFAATATGLGAGATVIAIAAGFVITSVLAQAAFRTFATGEEIQRDLKERACNSN